MNFNLKIARIKKGLYQDRVCKKIGVGRVTLSKLENEYGNPNLNLMIKLADVLETTVEELLLKED